MMIAAAGAISRRGFRGWSGGDSRALQTIEEDVGVAAPSVDDGRVGLSCRSKRSKK